MVALEAIADLEVTIKAGKIGVKFHVTDVSYADGAELVKMANSPNSAARVTLTSLQSSMPMGDGPTLEKVEPNDEH